MDEQKQLSPYDSITILKELATLNPLDDRAFKILLSDNVQFMLLAEALSGAKLDKDSIIDINGEIVMSVNGRAIRLDSLHDTNEGYVNMEGQIAAIDFPFKRHIFHSAAIYVNGIQKGDSWQNLKPVISIVVYKDKSDSELFESATITGKLVKTEDDRKQLRLIAVNTKKWHDAESETLKSYLSTLHHGILTEENRPNFAAVDVESLTFIDFQNAVKIACAKTKQQEYKKKGDDFMATQYASFITEEERQAAKESGIDIATEIIRLLKEGVSVAEIAKQLQVPTRRVESLKLVAM